MDNKNDRREEADPRKPDEREMFLVNKHFEDSFRYANQKVIKLFFCCYMLKVLLL